MNNFTSTVLKIVLATVGSAVALLPRWLEIRLGHGLGLFLLMLGGRRRIVAEENIRRCLPALDEQARATLLRDNYKHYGVLAFELFHLFCPWPGHYKKYVEQNTVLHGLDNWQAAHNKGKGLIFVAAHLGNWELMVGAGALAGIQLTMVTKHLKPEWLHNKVQATRLSVGVKGAYEPRTLPIVMRALRAGESVGFVMDQYAGPPIGVPVPFFGVKVGTLAAVSILVERTGAAVVPVKTQRDQYGKVHVYIEPELNVVDVVANNELCTAKLTACVEGWVRANPEQWLWIHRRFKNVEWPNELA